MIGCRQPMNKMVTQGIPDMFGKWRWIRVSDLAILISLALLSLLLHTLTNGQYGFTATSSLHSTMRAFWTGLRGGRPAVVRRNSVGNSSV